MTTELARTPLTVQDRADIADVVAKYGVHLDRREFGRLSEVFTPDVVLDYDLVGVRNGLGDALAFFSGSVASVQATQHLMHTTLIEADGAGAVGFVHVTAHHIAVGAALPAQSEQVYTVTGTYTDRYTHTSEGWRIAHRRLTLLTTTGDPSVLTLHRP